MNETWIKIFKSSGGDSTTPPEGSFKRGPGSKFAPALHTLVTGDRHVFFSVFKKRKLDKRKCSPLSDVPFEGAPLSTFEELQN
jgi:hypothetical protein